jgi:hypothetical protein
MSAIGSKRTSLAAPHMSAFGGKADMTWQFATSPQGGAAASAYAAPAVRAVTSSLSSGHNVQHVKLADQITEYDCCCGALASRPTLKITAQ